MGDILALEAPDRLMRTVADLVLKAARHAVRDRQPFVWGLSGGTTPVMLYRMPASERYAAMTCLVDREAASGLPGGG